MNAGKIRSVLFVTYHFPPEVGGIQTRISHYLKCLSQRGVSSLVFVITSKGQADGPSEGLVTVRRKRGGARNTVSNSVSLFRALGSSGADVVHVFTGASTLFGAVAVFAGRLRGLSTSVSFFGSEDFVSLDRSGRVLLLLTAAMANTISTNSESTMKRLPPSMRRKTTVLMGGSEPPSAAVPSEDSSRVLFVGRLVRRKGVDLLIRAFSAVSAKVEGARLVIVGDGPERAPLGALVQSLGVSSKVEFKGHLTGRPLAAEYASCSVCVLPSRKVPDDPANEGLGLVLIEASMYAKPLIGTRHGGIPEVVKDGKNGLLVEEGNVAQLAAAIQSILTAKDRAFAMGQEARSLAMKRYTWESATDRLLSSYSRVRDSQPLPQAVVP